jgi:hypothetical protein
MNLLSLFRRPAILPVPPDMTAALEPMFTGGEDGDGVALTGYPAYLGTQTDGEGIRYARFRFGFAPDAHVIIRTPLGKYCTFGAEAFMRGCDDLNPVPSALEVQQ